MAKAQAGKTYALVQGNRCHQIFTIADLPEWNENQIQVVDVTSSVPNVGDDWTGVAFVAHVPTAEEIAAQAKAAEKAAANAEKATVMAQTDVVTFVGKTPTQTAADANAANSVTALRTEVARLNQLVNILVRLYLK